MLIEFLGLIEAYRQLNSLDLHQTFETIQVPSIDSFQYSPTAYKYCRLRMDIFQSLCYTLNWNRNSVKLTTTGIFFGYNNNFMNFYSVTPELQISTLNPENVSSPFAISGGWNAGEPWPVEHVSSSANIDSAWYHFSEIIVQKNKNKNEIEFQ